MPEFTEVVEKRFRLAGMPRIETANVAGSTVIRGGRGEEVVVRATKRAQAESAERARRVLENVDVIIEQEGDSVRVSQRAFLVERGWLGLLRDRRAVVDYEIDVPDRAEVEARSTSGDVRVERVQGPVEVQTVSGDVQLDDVRGPLRARSVSGDVVASAFAGALEANSVSGDLRFERSALRSAQVRTVSGDVAVAARLAGAGPFGVTTVSGDVELLTPSTCTVVLHTMSGELRTEGSARIQRASRREFIATQGEGGPDVDVRTVSGDVLLAQREVDAPVPPEEPAPAPRRDRKAEAMAILEQLRRGELDLDEAGRRLDSVR